MHKRFWLVLSVTCIAACSDPAGVPTTRAHSLSASKTGSLTANVKQAISGTISFIGGQAGNFRTTPSGNCFFGDVPVYDHFEGDVVGPITFYEDERAPCDFSHLTGVGPFVAQVAWNGLSGTISGQWETNCKADPTQPIGLSCDGTMNGRGSGGLDGVNFHFKWTRHVAGELRQFGAVEVMTAAGLRLIEPRRWKHANELDCAADCLLTSAARRGEHGMRR